MTGDRDQDDDRGDSAPSLEPPSLFGRRRPRKPKPAPPPEPAPTAERPAEPTVAPPPEPEPEPTVVAPPVSPPPVSQPQMPAPTPVPPRAPVQVRDEPIVDVPKEPREPWLTGRPAAALTGLLVGALIVAATAGSLRVCTAVKGTATCGGPGFFLLVAILVVAVLVGGALLRGAQVPEPGSTAFLAVGLISVVTLLFLVGQLFQWWMVIAIPLVSIAMFLVSHWVTTTYIEPADG